jgi:hypothetical protein
VPRELGTQMSPNADAAGNGPGPTDVSLSTRFVAGSILETVFEPLFGTYTVPSSAIAGFAGARPTGIVATTFSVRVLTRETVFAFWLFTHTAVGETASPEGPLPTTIERRRFRLGSMRQIRRPVSSPTQTAPAPTRRFAGPAKPGIEILRDTLFVRGLIRASVPEP